MAYEFDTTVLGGLPVTIKFDVTRYDNRDCGGSGVNDVDDWSIVAVGGRACKTAPKWVYTRLTSADESAILEECCEHNRGL